MNFVPNLVSLNASVAGSVLKVAAALAIVRAITVSDGCDEDKKGFNFAGDQVYSLPVVAGHPQRIALAPNGDRFMFGPADSNDYDPRAALVRSIDSLSPDSAAAISSYDSAGKFKWMAAVFQDAASQSADRLFTTPNYVLLSGNCAVPGEFGGYTVSIDDGVGNDHATYDNHNPYAYVLAFDPASGGTVSAFGEKEGMLVLESDQETSIYDLKASRDNNTLYIAGTTSGDSLTVLSHAFDTTGGADFVLAVDATTGALRTAFGNGGLVIADFSGELDGPLALAVSTTDVYVFKDSKVAAFLTATGAADAAFGGGAYSSDDSIDSIAVSDDDKTLFVATVATSNHTVTALNTATGVPISTFGTAGVYDSGTEANEPYTIQYQTEAGKGVVYIFDHTSLLKLDATAGTALTVLGKSVLDLTQAAGVQNVQDSVVRSSILHLVSETAQVQKTDPLTGKLVSLPLVVSSATVASITPSTIPLGLSSCAILVTGAGFANGDTVQFVGQDRPTTFISATQLRVVLPGTDMVSAGTYQIGVRSLSGGYTNTVPLTLLPAKPVLRGLSPASIYPGGADFVLTLTGAGFTSDCVVLWSGQANLATGNATGGSLATLVPAAYTAATGSVQVSVQNSLGTSNALTFLIANDDVVPPPVVRNQVGGIQVDSAGNRYIAGVEFFTGTFDFNPNVGVDARHILQADAVVQRFNADGSYGWTQIFTGNSGEFGNALVVANNGTQDVVYVLGDFNSNNAGIGVPGTFSSNTSNGSFILALDAATGNPITTFGVNGVVTFTGSSNTEYSGSSAIAAANGNLYIVGSFSGTTFGLNTGTTHTLASHGSQTDAYIIALNMNTGAPISGFGSSNTVGIQVFGGSGSDDAYSVAATASAVYVGGSYKSTDAGVGASTGTFHPTGSEGAYVLALNPTTGAVLSGFGTGGVQNFGGTTFLTATPVDSVNALLVSGSSLYAGGSFSSTNAGIGGTGVAVAKGGDSDAFVLGLDAANGTALGGFGANGIVTFGGSTESNMGGEAEIVHGLALTGTTLYATGAFASTNAGINGTGTAKSNSAQNAFVLALNAGTGAPVTAFNTTGIQTFGGTGSDFAYGAAVAGTDVLLGGWLSSNNAGFNGATGTINGTNYGGFLLRLTSTGSAGTTRIHTDIGDLPDSDGDGYPDEVELALGSDPYDPSSTPAALVGIGDQDALIFSHFALKLDYTRKANDGYSAIGTIRLPADFVPAPEAAYLYMGGTVAAFTVDMSGQVHGRHGLSLKKKPDGTYAISIKHFNVDLHTDLAKAGLNASHNARDEKRATACFLLLNRTLYTSPLEMRYSIRAHQSAQGMGKTRQ